MTGRISRWVVVPLAATVTVRTSLTPNRAITVVFPIPRSVLERVVDYWVRYHIAKAVIAALLLTVLV